MILSDKQILDQLTEKENSLLLQLEKVRLAINAFKFDSFSGNEIKSNNVRSDSIDLFEDNIENEKYDEYLSYDQKVILALTHIKIGYINDMVDCLIKLGDKTDRGKLFGALTANSSKLYRKGILLADKRGKKYRYSLNPDTEQERTEILSF